MAVALQRRHLAVLAIARKQLGLSEREWRDVLVCFAGVTSARDLKVEEFHVIMGYFDYLGFQPTTPRGEDFGDRPGMASYAQLSLIRTLWAEYTRGRGDEDTLSKWLQRSFKRSSLRFVTAGDAQRIITALKEMKARASA